jgi:putative transposase
MPSHSVGMRRWLLVFHQGSHAYASAKACHPCRDLLVYWWVFSCVQAIGRSTIGAMRDETPGKRPKFKTCKRYNDAGHAHALTFCCLRRQKFLTSPRTLQWLVDAIDLACRKHQFDLWAYVIMPEHVHLVVCPRRDEYDMSRFLSTLKLSVTRKALAFVQLEKPESLPLMLDAQPNGEHHYRFWQRGGGFDRNLWSDKAIFAEIDYVHANPIRRGLCEKPEDWAWSSAADYCSKGPGPLSIDFGSLPRTFQTERSSRSRRPG